MSDATTENLTKAFQEHMQAKVRRKPALHYVYYDTNGLILCITNKEMQEFSEKSFCMLPTSEVIDFLQGTKAANEYVIVQDEKDMSFKLKKREIELNLIRNMSKFLSEITEQYHSDAALEIFYKPTEKQIRFRLNPALRETLAKLNANTITIQGFLSLTFYFTAPSDPFILIEKVTIAAESLVNQEEIWTSVENDLLGTSLYVRKVFPEYSYAIENKE